MSHFKEYKHTFSYADSEKQILSFWTKENIFEKSLINRQDSPVFSFCEGPPTVNGLPGIHHIFSRTVKDIICRYKTMKGYLVRRQAGWDTHGLPVEIAVEKKLNLKSNTEVINYGIEDFCAEAKKLVYSHINDAEKGWGKLTSDMGYWCDMNNAYITCSNSYIESVWWSIKEIFNKNLIYKDYKIVPQDPKSESVLSSHELALGYKETKDPSVYIKFKLKNKNEYFLAWTTTPWTLISNVFLCVNPSITYVKVRFNDEVLILAEQRLSCLKSDQDTSPVVLSRFNGKSLEYLEYEPLYPYLKSNSKTHFVALGDFVSTDDGTGIVHCAPAFGADDYETSKKYQLPMFQPVKRNGCFTDEAPMVKGMFFKDADVVIIKDLKQRNLLLRKETITHSYPFSWRYDVPVMYYARESWFIRTSEIAQKMSELNKKINWIPPEVGKGRFGNWLAENKDWALSRNRFWGTPLPIWVSDDFKTGDSLSHQNTICIGSIEELKKGYLDINENRYTLSEALDQNLISLDLHKPLTDKIYFIKNNKTFKRTSEVIDVWYDSGAAPFAQFHYPFENKDLFEKHFPLDFISEGIDQTRGWFYTLHATSSLVFKSLAFKNVSSLGLLLDKDGQKMSKSKGNVVDPFDSMKTYGADCVRWYLVSGTPNWQPKRFDTKELIECQRKFFRAFLESYKFFSMYANLDKFQYSEKPLPLEKRTELDQWILSRMHSVVSSFTKKMDDYHISESIAIIENFVVNDLSNWYIRRSRRRFWKESPSNEKLASYQTLYDCLITVAKLSSIVAPFFSDEIYRNLNSMTKLEKFDSVHLSSIPRSDDNFINHSLEKSMSYAQIISSLVRTMRERASIKVRQPLEQILIVTSEKAKSLIEKHKNVILDEINVKQINYVDSDSHVVTKTVKPNFKLLGPKFGSRVNVVASKIKELTTDEISIFEHQGFIKLDIENQEVKIEISDVEIIYHDLEGWLVERDQESNLIIALDAKINDSLVKEGLVREFISKIQSMRKNKGYDVSDKITISYSTHSELLKNALTLHEEHLTQETLAKSIILDNDSDKASDSLYTINTEKCFIDIYKNN